MLTQREYRTLVYRARIFAHWLIGDDRYLKPEINRIALENALVGWLWGTKAFKDYAATAPKNDPLWTLAKDQAQQAAQDAIFSDKEDGLVTYFYSVEELNHMVGDLVGKAKSRFANQVAQSQTALDKKIAAAKKKLGIPASFDLSDMDEEQITAYRQELHAK